MRLGGGLLIYTLVLLASSTPSLSQDIARDPLIREQKTVVVDGQAETWQLRWASEPKSACGSEEADMSLTCPCDGFAYGEEGRLSLIRKRG